ncbi:MAG: hypothetical protein KC431_21870 [Myxococcales bacterium]|nr:hypothetical protein [Myxococcales bacterium]
MSGREPIDRLIEHELLDGLGRDRRRSLLDRLRGNGDDRRRWDRAIAAFRVLEDRAVSRTEVDQVERWLFEDLAADGVLVGEAAASGRRRWWAPWVAGLSTLAAATALLLLVVERPDGDEDGVEAQGRLLTIVDDGELQARGAIVWPRPLAIDALCGQPPRSSTMRGCDIDELLGFSARLDGDAGFAGEPGSTVHLSLFGIDDGGRLRYYAPTPDGAALDQLLRVEAEPRWQALPMSVRLGVNHRPGSLRIFAIATPEPASVADVERWTAALREQGPAGVDDPPWHLRLSSADLGPQVCDGLRRRCASAETTLTIHAHE